MMKGTVMRVLVAHGSKMGGTKGIANMVADRLDELGFDADVRPASEVEVLDPYEVVLVGAGLYANRWYKDGVRFVKRHRRSLRDKSVWFFSSGPLDTSATSSTIPPTKQVSKLMGLAGAKGHVTFGGKLDRDVEGFPASAMAKENAGDFRDREQIEAWVDEVAASVMESRSVR